MIYEFHDDKNGTAKEKRVKAFEWLAEHYDLVESGYRDEYYKVIDLPTCGNNVYKGDARIVFVPLKNSIELNIIEAYLCQEEMAYQLAKIFNEVETCCDMFERGKMK